MEFSPDGRLLAVAHDEGRTQLFDVPSGEALGPALQANASGVNDVSFSADGARMATAGLDRTGALWRLDGRRSIGTSVADHSAAVTEVHYTPDGRMLVTAGADGEVVVRDVAADRVRHVLHLGGEVLTVGLDASGRRVAAAGTNGAVRVFDLATGAPVAELDVGASWVHQVAFDPVSGALAVAVDNGRGTGESTGDEPGHVLVWDPRTGKEVGPRIVRPDGLPVGLAWRPDGGQLAVAMDNNVIRLYDRASHRQVGRDIDSVDSSFSALAFSPDGRRLATGAFSGLVLQWSTATQRRLGPALEGHTGAVAGLAYSPDGRLLASTTLGFGATRLWDSATGAALGGELIAGQTPFTVRNFRIEHFTGSRPAFTPDGTHLATAGFDGLTTVWDLRPQRWLAAACAVAGRQLTKAEWTQHVSPAGSPRRCGS
jgi:WD40 repeat protein